MKLNNLVKNNKRKIRVGRGIGSGRGKTSSRGHKGQKIKIRCSYQKFWGWANASLQTATKRGFKTQIKKNIAILNLAKIQNILDKNSNDIKNSIDLKILKDKKLVSKNSQN